MLILKIMGIEYHAAANMRVLTGYPMAKNLRAKIPERDVLVIHDRNGDATAKFLREVGIAASSVGTEGKGINIEVVDTPRAVAENSVGDPSHFLTLFGSHDEYVLSMI